MLQRKTQLQFPNAARITNTVSVDEMRVDMNRRATIFSLTAFLVLGIAGWSQNIAPTATRTPVTNPAVGNGGVPSAVATSTKVPERPPSGFSERNPRYQLTPGDSIDLQFKFSPEFNQNGVPVQPDGFVTLDAVGDVQVIGLSLPEVTQKLKATYSTILKDPEIVVKLREFNKPYFVASGQLVKPGKYELRAATTLSQAIAIAGGFTEASKHSQVWLFRPLPDGNVQSREINVKDMLAKGNLREDIPLHPGDTIWVPQNTWSKVKGVIVTTSSPAGAIGPWVH
jgi:polysaccharide export outer membrane protein